MLAVFDSGATRTVILRKLITNGNVELIEWGKDTSTQGLSNIQVGGQAAKVFIPAPETDPEVRGYHIWAIIQDVIIQTLDKYPPLHLLEYSVDKLQGIPGYERAKADNFQPRLGGNVEMLIGNDLTELHPKVISVIHDGFNIVHHRARLYNTDQFLGFSGVFPTGMEPIYQLESHPRALHYADHPQQADHEMQSVFPEAASAHQNR